MYVQRYLDITWKDLLILNSLQTVKMRSVLLNCGCYMLLNSYAFYSNQSLHILNAVSIWINFQFSYFFLPFTTQGHCQKHVVAKIGFVLPMT